MCGLFSREICHLGQLSYDKSETSFHEGELTESKANTQFSRRITETKIPSQCNDRHKLSAYQASGLNCMLICGLASDGRTVLKETESCLPHNWTCGVGTGETFHLPKLSV